MGNVIDFLGGIFNGDEDNDGDGTAKALENLKTYEFRKDTLKRKLGIPEKERIKYIQANTFGIRIVTTDKVSEYNQERE